MVHTVLVIFTLFNRHHEGHRKLSVLNVTQNLYTLFLYITFIFILTKTNQLIIMSALCSFSDTKISKEGTERLAVFTWNPKTDVTPLLKLLSELSVFEYWTVCGCIFHLAEYKWKSYVDRSSTIFLYHSYSPEKTLPDLSCLKKFLDHSREKHGKIVILNHI